MPYFLSPHLTFNHLDTEHEDFTRLSIFLFVAECVGVPALVWALTVLHRHRKHKGRVSVFIILLLLCDMMELLSNPYIATQLIHKHCYSQKNAPCWILLLLWWGLRHSGVYLQQMMVLENVLALRRPHYSAHILMPFCSITLSFTASIGVFLLEYFMEPSILILSLFPLFAVTVTSWIISYRTPPMKKHGSNETTEQDWTVLVCASVTMFLYLMSITLYTAIQSQALFIMSECLLSLRVAIEPLLCVLVCRQEQTHTSSDLSTHAV